MAVRGRKLHKKQWLVLAVGIGFAVGAFCVLSQLSFQPPSFSVQRVVNPDKSVTGIKTYSFVGGGLEFTASGWAFLASAVVLAGTVFTVKKMGRSLPSENKQVFAHAEADAGVWPPPPETPQPAE